MPNNFRPLKARARWTLACAALLLAGASHAQLAPDDPDRVESEAPPPPAFSTDKLLPLAMPPYVSVQFGIDPATLSISEDSIVRYVVVTRNSTGTVNAMYEGVRCSTGEVKTYARASGSGGWKLVDEPQWRELNDNQPSKHAWVFARQGGCDGRAATASSPAEIIKALKK